MFLICRLLKLLFGFLDSLSFAPYRRILTYRDKGKLLSQMNKHRNKMGLTPLGRVKLLGQIAYGHSKSMARTKHCDHRGFARRKRIIETKMGISYIGENCFMYPSKRYGRRTAHALLRRWLRSPGHRRNIENSSYKRTGIGIVHRGNYIYATQIFTG